MRAAHDPAVLVPGRRPYRMDIFGTERAALGRLPHSALSYSPGCRGPRCPTPPASADRDVLLARLPVEHSFGGFLQGRRIVTAFGIERDLALVFGPLGVHAIDGFFLRVLVVLHVTRRALIWQDASSYPIDGGNITSVDRGFRQLAAGSGRKPIRVASAVCLARSDGRGSNADGNGGRSAIVGCGRGRGCSSRADGPSRVDVLECGCVLQHRHSQEPVNRGPPDVVSRPFDEGALSAVEACPAVTPPTGPLSAGNLADAR